MRIAARAILLSARIHGEHGVIARALTPDDGVQPGYVRGGRSRALRPVLQPGNIVLGEWRARTEDALPGLTVELVTSRAALHAQPIAAAALEWVTALTTAALPEGQPYPRLHDGLDGLLLAMEAAPGARGWGGALVRYELLLLAELGFGLDLETCAVTGARDDLAWVSPKTGCAVGRTAAAGHEARLLPYPLAPADDWGAILGQLRTTGHFLARDLLHGRAADTLAARDRLLDRLRLAAG